MITLPSLIASCFKRKATSAMGSQQTSPYKDPDVEEEFYELSKIVIENPEVDVMIMFCDYGQMLSLMHFSALFLELDP